MFLPSAKGSPPVKHPTANPDRLCLLFAPLNESVHPLTRLRGGLTRACCAGRDAFRPHERRVATKEEKLPRIEGSTVCSLTVNPEVIVRTVASDVIGRFTNDREVI